MTSPDLNEAYSRLPISSVYYCLAASRTMRS